MLTPRLRLTAAPALLALLVLGCASARAQQVARADAPRADAPDYSYLLKSPETAGTAPRAEGEEPAPRPVFGSRDASPLVGDEPQNQGGQQQQDPNSQAAAQPYVPLTSGQKMRRAFKSAFLSPRPYVMSAISATLTQMGEDELPDKEFEDEFGDWGSRFARNMANRTTRTIFSSGVYPVLFKQDPRYERAPKKGFARRAAHAASRVFVTRGDNGNIQPNFSRFAGVVTAASLSNIWERSTPGHDRRGVDATTRRILMSFPNDMFNNVVREFLPDIIRIFRK